MAIALAAALLAPACSQASDKYGFAFKETFGSAAQPSFTEPTTLAVDPATGDLLVADAGQNETQKITFNNFAAGDKFKLTWTPPGGSAETTTEIAYASSGGSVSTKTENDIQAALEAKFGSGSFNLSGSFLEPTVYINFTGAYATAPQSLLSCARVSGSGTCPVTRTREGTPSGLSRFKPNGEPDPFSALGTNTIDGREGADQTPQEGLSLNQQQIAVDGACAEHEPPLTGSECTSFDPADGDIYVAQSGGLADVFSSSGEYLGQIDEATSNEVQKLELSGFAAGDEFSLANLPGACSGSSTAQVPFDAVFGDSLQATLEAQCGPDFSARATVSVDVEFSGELGDADMPNLICHVLAGPGSCSVTTVTPGDATHNEVSELEFSGLAEGSEFSLEFNHAAGEVSLPSPPCEGTPSKRAYSTTLAASIRTTLEAVCGPNFAVSLAATASAKLTFTNTLGLADQPQLSCAVATGAGACAASTVEDGGLAKPLGAAAGVAVDPAGAAYVSDSSNDEIHKYLPTSNSPFEAETVAGFPVEGPQALAAGAGPTGGSLFYERKRNEPVKLDSATGEERYLVGSSRNATLLAVNPADGTLLSVNGGFEVAQYDASGPSEAVRLAHFEPYEVAPNRSNIHGIAVDPVSGDLYEASKKQGEATGTVAVFERLPLPEAITEAADEIGGEEATLHGKVSAAGGPPAACEFQYITETAFNAKEQGGFRKSSTAPCTPAGPFTGSSFQSVSAHLEGLSPGTHYRFRVLATNKAGSTPEDFSEGAEPFTTLGPAIAEQEVGEIGETEATLSAQLNPNEEQTAYAVEYVSEADFQSSEYDNATVYPLPQRTLEAGSEFVHVEIALAGLPPDSAWHARIAAANAVAVHGPDQRFATYPVAGMLDGRAYEMVSPTRKKGEVLPPNPSIELGSSCRECLPGESSLPLPQQAAPDGESVLYAGQPFAEGLSAESNDYLSRRGPGGWDWRSESPSTVAGLWAGFSPDLSRGILEQSEPPLSPAAPTAEGRAFDNLYLREEGGAFEPLLTEAPPHRVPGIYGVGLIENQFFLRFAGANAGVESAPAFSHILFEANDALTAADPGVAPKAPEVPESGIGGCGTSPCNLYEWSGGQLRLVNVFPGNSVAVSKSVIGSGRLLATDSSGAGAEEAPNVSTAISAGGRIVFFSTQLVGHVYARIDGERTLTVPGPGTCKESVKEVTERACFLTASPDGHRVLLANGQIDELNEEETSFAQTYDLSEGEGGFQGILGNSDDLSRVYFVDTAALTPSGEANENGEHAEAGKLNLYAWREGASAFLGQLAAGDNTIDVNNGYGAWKASPSNRTAQVTPDGRWLAFQSSRPLTGRTGGVFEYAADDGKLVCVSCNPTGLPPRGKSNLSAIKTQGAAGPFAQPHNLSPEGHGRLFFESADRLSAAATATAFEQGGHGPARYVQNVYEYEPQGVGSCERANGCVQLISSGDSSTPSMFLDSSRSGDDAFFVTRSRLVPGDKDSELDLYDARVGGGFEESEVVPCEGEACKGASPPAPGEAASAGSAAFAGPGNPAPAAAKPRCKKGKVRRRGRCVAKHHRHRRKHRKHRHKRHPKRAVNRNQGGSR